MVSNSAKKGPRDGTLGLLVVLEAFCLHANGFDQHWLLAGFDLLVGQKGLQQLGVDAALFGEREDHVAGQTDVAFDPSGLDLGLKGVEGLGGGLVGSLSSGEAVGEGDGEVDGHGSLLGWLGSVSYV